MKFELIMEGWRDWIGLDKKAEPEEELEPEEEEEDLSQEAKLAMLALHEDEANRDQALMMFEMLADGLDLDLLASELDKRLQDMMLALGEPPEYPVTPLEREISLGTLLAQYPDHPYAVYLTALDVWYEKISDAARFITGDYINRGFRPSTSSFRHGSMKDSIAMALRQTVTLWRKR